MEKDLARHIARTCFFSIHTLHDLLDIIKNNCSSEEYTDYGKAIADITGRTGLEVLNRIFKEHPEIEQEISASIARYGKYI